MVHFLNDALVDLGSAYGGVGELMLPCSASDASPSCYGAPSSTNGADSTSTSRPSTRNLQPSNTYANTGAAQKRPSAWLLVSSLCAHWVSCSRLCSSVWTCPKAIGSAAGLLVVVRAVWWTMTAAYEATNVIVRRDEGGNITGIIRWHTTYTGNSALDTVNGIDILDAISEIARIDHQPVILNSGNKVRQNRFAALGYYPSSGRRPFLRIHIPADPGLPAEWSGEVHGDHPSSRTGSTQSTESSSSVAVHSGTFLSAQRFFATSFK